MNSVLGSCPICSNQLTVTRLQCGSCGTGLDGQFSLGRLQTLSPEQVSFVETFIKCRGKIKDVETELGISYPTVVARLNEVISAMGFEVSEEDLSDVDRFEYYQAQVINPVAPAPRITAPQAPVQPVAPHHPAHAGHGRLSPEARQQVLDELAEGKISASDALKKING